MEDELRQALRNVEVDATDEGALERLVALIRRGDVAGPLGETLHRANAAGTKRTVAPISFASFVLGAAASCSGAILSHHPGYADTHGPSARPVLTTVVIAASFDDFVTIGCARAPLYDSVREERILATTPIDSPQGAIFRAWEDWERCVSRVDNVSFFDFRVWAETAASDRVRLRRRIAEAWARAEYARAGLPQPELPCPRDVGA